MLWSDLDLGASVCSDFYEIESPICLESLGDLRVGQSAIFDGLNHVTWSNIACIEVKEAILFLNNEGALAAKAKRDGAYTQAHPFTKKKASG